MTFLVTLEETRELYAEVEAATRAEAITRATALSKIDTLPSAIIGLVVANVEEVSR